jgi:hypothetical protein
MKERRLESEVFLRNDVENILRAINAANLGIAQHISDPSAAIYRAGFTDAVKAVAMALHIEIEVGGECGSVVERGGS